MKRIYNKMIYTIRTLNVLFAANYYMKYDYLPKTGIESFLEENESRNFISNFHACSIVISVGKPGCWQLNWNKG